MRVFLLLFAALIVAGGTGYYAWLGTRPEPVAPVAATIEAPKPTEVFTAAGDLPMGTILRADNLGRMPLAKTSVTAEMVVADETGETLLIGGVARQILPKGMPIARSAIVQPGDRGFLAAVLPQGKRAVSIPITEVSGVSGFALPGDRVDVILTYSVTAEFLNEKRDIHASETVARNLRVLALDQRTSQDHSLDEKLNGLPVADTATLEVTPAEAETITLATTLGTLSLSLNSVRDGGEAVAAMPDRDPLERISGRMAKPVAPAPQAMTLDSEVTTLLNRRNDDTVAQRLRAVPVQVVRGRKNSLVAYGGDAAAPPGGTPESGGKAPTETPPAAAN